MIAVVSLPAPLSTVLATRGSGKAEGCIDWATYMNKAEFMIISKSERSDFASLFLRM